MITSTANGMAEVDHAPLFTPLAHAAVLYPGKVMHARLKPFGHRFNYRVFSCLFDLDKLDQANKLARCFSVNRFNLLAFHEKDHLPQVAAATLRLRVNLLVEKTGLNAPARVLLLAYPRLLGYAFNPISVYFCYNQTGALTAAIYEVRNTFGERHSYVCAVENGELTPAGLRQERTKIFYVSPFIEMGMRYHFRVLPPGENVKLRIFETDKGAPLLSATFTGNAKPFDDRHLLVQVARLPFMTLKIVAGIHYEALKLWIKGAKFQRRGKPPVAVSYRDAKTAGDTPTASKPIHAPTFAQPPNAAKQ